MDIQEQIGCEWGHFEKQSKTSCPSILTNRGD